VVADQVDAAWGPEGRRHAILNLVKVAVIGAGSTVFAKTLIGDLISYPELAGDMTIALMDVDEDRLRTSELVAQKLVETAGANARVEASRDRRTVLDGADYVLTMMQVGGYRPASVTDFEVPKHFGLRQTIGDTLGIGGIMRGLRTIPVLLDVCRDMEDLCPDALLLQYVNPMAMLCWAVARTTSIATIGLCHSVQGTAGDLERDLGLPPGELEYVCAGINHLAFYLELQHAGRDLYPELRAKEDVPEWNRVRYEVLRHFGYFCTESSEHLAEYVPWFIKQARPELADEFNVLLDEYPRRCEAQIAEWEELRGSLENGVAPATTRSDEYGARIVHALTTGEPFTFNGNVMNHGLIDNLPECCVEVPCVADERGISPESVGSLPPQLAGLIQTNLNVQALTVEAALTGKREHVYHAAMLDPHTAAELPLAEIHELVDRLLEAHGELIPALV
jgi:alpha-galactosidase